MATPITVELDEAVLQLRMTDGSDPDLSIMRPLHELQSARRTVVDAEWTQLHQVHGTDVVAVDAPGMGDGATGDAVVTSVSGAVLAVQVADCVPVALWSAAGTFCLAHAGWKGTVSGVVEAAVLAVTTRSGPSPVRALVGHCICAACYEFGASDLQLLVDRYGPAVASVSRSGTPALDMRAAVTAALRTSGVQSVVHLNRCTSCSAGLWSHRARADQQRQALVGWLEPRPGGGGQQ